MKLQKEKMPLYCSSTTQALIGAKSLDKSISGIDYGSCTDDSSWSRRSSFESLSSLRNLTESNASDVSHRSSTLTRKISDMLSGHSGSIGLLGSTALAVNSLTGPAMLNLPATFQRSGIIPTTCTLVLVCILSSLCCMHMANTISMVPGNQDFKKEVEFSEAFRRFKGERWYTMTQILFFCCITCLNISSIVDTSQVVDTLFGHWSPGGAVAVKVLKRSEGESSSLYEWVTWNYSSCTSEELYQGACLPFKTGYDDTQDDDQILFLTAGTFLTTAMFFPIALMDLKENIFAQIIGFPILLLFCAQFVVQVAVSDDWSFDNLSWWGHSWSDMLGVVLFNFVLVIAIPAWLYERDSDVDVSTVIHGSNVLSLMLYIVVGLVGNLAMSNVSENMLVSLMSGSMGLCMQITASVFAFFIIGLSIPLFSVLVRLNLEGSGLVSHGTANILAVYLPFLASWFLGNSDTIANLLGWGGVIFTGMVAFILPLLLAIHAVKRTHHSGSVPVYFGYFEGKEAQLYSLYVLFAIAAITIIAAIAGLLFG